jgi:hypothetical protein
MTGPGDEPGPVSFRGFYPDADAASYQAELLALLAREGCEYAIKVHGIKRLGAVRFALGVAIVAAYALRWLAMLYTSG